MKHPPSHSSTPSRSQAAAAANPADQQWAVALRSGDAVHWIRFEGLVDELYDVITLPGARNPSLIGFVSDEIRRLISIEEAG